MAILISFQVWGRSTLSSIPGTGIPSYHNIMAVLSSKSASAIVRARGGAGAAAPMASMRPCLRPAQHAKVRGSDRCQVQRQLAIGHNGHDRISSIAVWHANPGRMLRVSGITG